MGTGSKSDLGSVIKGLRERRIREHRPDLGYNQAEVSSEDADAMSISALLAVAGGGVVGAVARYLVYIAVGHLLGSGFPYATLIVNIVGSFVMGALIELMALVWSTSMEMRLCALYTIASFILSVGALFAGLHVVRRLVPPPV
jgi:fluoride exporter